MGHYKDPVPRQEDDCHETIQKTKGEPPGIQQWDSHLVGRRMARNILKLVSLLSTHTTVHCTVGGCATHVLCGHNCRELSCTPEKYTNGHKNNFLRRVLPNMWYTTTAFSCKLDSEWGRCVVKSKHISMYPGVRGDHCTTGLGGALIFRAKKSSPTFLDRAIDCPLQNIVQKE